MRTTQQATDYLRSQRRRWGVVRLAELVEVAVRLERGARASLGLRPLHGRQRLRRRAA